ncbi:MAG TPA: hypothetical protein VI485_14945 [Vicinamibacterales bacterium]|nr:hypothetical protein [Vicinamibacterales bacterium]
MTKPFMRVAFLEDPADDAPIHLDSFVIAGFARNADAKMFQRISGTFTTG